MTAGESTMRTRVGYVFMLGLVFLVGCVSSYQSMDEVPDAKRPVYEVTYRYMQCGADNLAALLEAGELPAGVSREQGLEQLAARACEACGTELAAYSDFVSARTGSPEIADVEAAKLKARTQEYMVRDVLDQAAP